MTKSKSISKTYKETVEDFILEVEKGGKAEMSGDWKEAMRMFAKHLDNFTHLDDKLQILAFQKAREIDGQVLFALAKELPKQKVEEIIKGVYAKHHKRNTKSTT